MLKLGQKFGLGLGPKLLASASASKLSGLGLEVLASASRLARTAHVWLLPHVNRSFRSQAPMNRPNMRYITYTSTPTLSTTLRLNWQNSIATFHCFQCCSPCLHDRLFCIPASSAPVERVFSQSGLIMSARRARMSNAVLESLIFLKCSAEMYSCRAVQFCN